MKKLFRYPFLALCTFIVFSSCKKDDVSKADLLTDRNWKLVSDMSKVGNGAWTEEISFYKSCEMDNYIDFRKDHTYESNEGATRCNASDPQSEDGTWAFQDNETTLMIDADTVNIEVLSETSLIVSESETFQGVTYYYKLTFSH